MASIPTGGTFAAVARLLAQHPIAWLKGNALLQLEPFVRTPDLVRELFFTPDTPQAIVDSCFARLQDESYLAFIDTMVVLPRPHRVRAPLLVMGAEQDAFFTVDEVRRTARAYGTEAEIFPCMGHNMMLDRNWRAVADRINAWLLTTVAIRSDHSTHGGSQPAGVRRRLGPAANAVAALISECRRAVAADRGCVQLRRPGEQVELCWVPLMEVANEALFFAWREFPVASHRTC
jgi:hypothetical protein